MLIMVEKNPDRESFSINLLKEVLQDICLVYDDNIDIERFGPSVKVLTATGVVSSIRKRLSGFLTNAKALPDLDGILERVEGFHGHMDGFVRLYGLLADGYSKELLVKLVAFRMLGNSHVKLPLNTPEYWDKREIAKSLATGGDKIKVCFMDWELHLFELGELDYPIRMYLLPMAICARFIIKSYEYRTAETLIKVEKGDVVIDAGGCWGDTALFFAHEVGPEGKVHSFEFIPGNIALLEKNIDLNPRLKSRIEIVRAPLWETSDKVLYFTDNGPGSVVNEQKVSDEFMPVTTVSIDDYIEEKGLDRVDFVKMDIEGAELNALKGAEKTLRKFKPKLAISLYHKLSDFYTIPDFLSSLGLGYEFYIGHFTIHSEETVLFGRPGRGT